MPLPSFNADGNLPLGIYSATWQEFVDYFGFTDRRQELLLGLRSVLYQLKKVNCRVVYIGGSFVTSKAEPGDFDGFWDPTYVDLVGLEKSSPELLRSDRKIQKAKYGGELFADMGFLKAFNKDREQREKGIVAIDLESLPP
jgi:hypothetical protein